jgi:hypothetical protein
VAEQKGQGSIGIENVRFGSRKKGIDDMDRIAAQRPVVCVQRKRICCCDTTKVVVGELDLAG